MMFLRDFILTHSLVLYIEAALCNLCTPLQPLVERVVTGLALVGFVVLFLGRTGARGIT